jgi:L-seryl-tRNA(Ser) seleniumtransferase
MAIRRIFLRALSTLLLFTKGAPAASNSAQAYAGMMVALERFLKRDCGADWKEHQKRSKVIEDSVSSLGGITTELEVLANHLPHLHIRWDPSRIRISPVEAGKVLLGGYPSIEVNAASNHNAQVTGVWMLQPEEAQIVAKRLREALRASA